MTTDSSTALDIEPITIEEEMKKSYLDYAMSVIVSRAIPDVRDGLKPVHRRILFAMGEVGLDYNRPYKKSARTVGDVMAKYHPHGEMAIYDALVRMAQDFSMGLMLVDGQGNFGSVDGDPAAAMRYTESRLSRPSHYLLEDIDKDTIDFKANYDESMKEPTLLPARFPNVLVNGASGIAVGMATNIPPHNLGELLDACCAYVDNPDVTLEELMELVPGPDFPTGGSILGRAGILSAFQTGRGSVLMRAKTHIEEIRKDREAIIVTQIPYQVNKAKLVARIAELVHGKIIEGISDLRDESDRQGMRVVIELKRDAVSDVVLSLLHRHTSLQTSFGVNMLALNKGQPILMGLKDVLVAFVEFREEVITRRTRFELDKARNKAHVLAGLAIAVANIDPVIALIRNAADPEVARQQLMEKPWPAESVAPLIALIDDPEYQVVDGKYKLSEVQARAILELRLHRLTGLERDKIGSDLEALAAVIKDYLEILASRPRRLAIMKEEFLEVKEKFAVPRRTQIEDGEFTHDMESLIQREEMVVTVSHEGYIKRVPLSTYRSQKRGGRGRTGMSTRDEDFVDDLFVANTHTPVLFFSKKGKVYQLKVYRLPMGSAQARGKAMVNIFPVDGDENISTVLPLPEDREESEGKFIFFATSSGNVRRNSIDDFSNIRANGKIAMKLDDGEKLIGVSLCSEGDTVLLSTKLGKCIRFPMDKVRVFAGRASNGVRGIKLAKDDEVISMCILKTGGFSSEEREMYLKQANRERRGDDAELDTENATPTLPTEKYQEMAEIEQFILTVSEKGFGKRTSSYAYRQTNRGGSGIVSMSLTEKTGEVVSSFPVLEGDQVMLVTNGGQLIRCPIHDIRLCGRQSQGVILFRVGKGEKVVSVTGLTEENLARANVNGDDEEESSESMEGAEATEATESMGGATEATESVTANEGDSSEATSIVDSTEAPESSETETSSEAIGEDEGDPQAE